MPSALHESLIELFRADLRLIERLAGPALSLPPAGLGALRTMDGSLGEAQPLERRVDLAILPDHGPVLLLEVQLDPDAEKRWTWPSYVVLTRDRMRREVVLVVVTLREAVARWARQTIPLDARGSCLVPLVIGPRDIPLLTDPGEAIAHPERLVLSALVHGKGSEGLAIAQAASQAVPLLDEDRAGIYTDLILNALGDAARAALEAALFPNYEFQNETIRRFIRLGKEEGRTEGKAEGKAEGAYNMAMANLLEVLQVRQIPIDDEARAFLQACPSADVLHSYLRRALTASTFAQVIGD